MLKIGVFIDADNVSDEQAISWLLSDSVSPFSFRVCCRYDNHDPDTLRRLIIRAVQRIETRGA